MLHMTSQVLCGLCVACLQKRANPLRTRLATGLKSLSALLTLSAPYLSTAMA